MKASQLSLFENPIPRPERARGGSSYLAPREGWLTFALLAFVLLSVVWSVERAGWTKLPSLSFIALLASLAGLTLAKIGMPSFVLHPLGLLLGFEVVIWQTAATLPGTTWGMRLDELAIRMQFWADAVKSGSASSDMLPFILLLVSLTWLIGYLSSWFVFRYHSAWWGVVPGGIAILVNLSYLPQSFTPYFMLYLLGSMMLTMRLNVIQQQERWQSSQTSYPEGLGRSFLGQVILFSTALLIIAWQLPVGKALGQLTEVRDKVESPWREMETEFDRLFSAITSPRGSESAYSAPLHSFGEGFALHGAIGPTSARSHPLGGSVRPSKKLALTVESDQPYYWRGRVYDTYTGEGWASSRGEVKALGEETVQGSAEDYRLRKEVTQRVELGFASSILFAAGQPLRVDIPAQAETTHQRAFTIDLRDSSTDSQLPPDIRSVAERLRKVQSPSVTRLVRSLPPGLAALNVSTDEPRVRTIDVARSEPNPGDIMAVMGSRRLKKSERYEVTSSVSVATTGDLRTAGSDYPHWVTDNFLQLLPTLPARIRELSQSLTAGVDNTYDKAVVIERYLRGLRYDLNISAPPQGSDGVDYFLFTSKVGYCDYFASAMVVMLRSIDIPARLAVGYASGYYDSAKGAYLVREADAHAWPEVFFPNYGWVDFEPTPAWPQMGREVETLDAGIEDEFEEYYDDELYEGGDLGNAGSSTTSLSWSRVARPIGAVAGLVVFVFVLALGSWQYGLRGLVYAARVYEEMCRLASFSGLGPRSQQTPHEYAQRLASALPPASQSIGRVTDGYTRVQYGKKSLSDDEKKAIERAWRSLRGKLLLKMLRWK